MAALLDIIHLRRHALPADFHIGCTRQPDRMHGQPGVPREPVRPRLIAAWHVGVDGRLACTWSAAADDPAQACRRTD